MLCVAWSSNPVLSSWLPLYEQVKNLRIVSSWKDSKGTQSSYLMLVVLSKLSEQDLDSNIMSFWRNYELFYFNYPIVVYISSFHALIVLATFWFPITILIDSKPLKIWRLLRTMSRPISIANFPFLLPAHENGNFYIYWQKMESRKCKCFYFYFYVCQSISSI